MKSVGWLVWIGVAAFWPLPQAAAGQSPPLSGRIKIDTDRTIGQIDPLIYGNFIEHLGRCIEGGVFQENSPLSDSKGYRRDVLDAVKKLNVSILRWPGGNFASGYHWEDGIGPRDRRPARLELAWGTTENNRFGTHEFLDYAEMLGTQPYICVNLGTGTLDEAKFWVEYCNVAGGTHYSEWRKKNGREKPWGVTYWGLGNEMDGFWQMGHKNAEDYSKFALEAAKLMKWTDPTIKLIAAGSSHYSADWVSWNRTVLQYLKEHIDYLALHLYVGNRNNDYYEFLTSSLDLSHKTKVAEGLIQAALADNPRKRSIYVAWDEWNVWYRARGPQQRGRHILEEKYNLEDALVVATFLNTFINNAHVVKMANMAQLVNVIAPIFTDDKSLFLQTIYYPLQIFANHSKGTALDVFVDSPTYRTQKYDAVPFLDVSAAHDNGTLVLNVVNRHRDQPIEVEILCQQKSFNGSFDVAEVNGPDIKAENTFGTTKVQANRKKIAASGAQLKYQFPPHSYTMIKGRLR
ncbi:MAG: alpha-L-arabinofuranosidase C-terminal domain-containing protein [Acidobacteriota bacterium]